MTCLDELELHELLFHGENPSPLEDKLLALLENSLSEGEPLFLEGIGIVSLDPHGKLCIQPTPHPRVFLAHVVEDIARVREIYRFLKKRGFEPWMDVERLLPGQNWPRAIERAIESADFVVPCFSKVSSSKCGFFQAELRYALDCAQMHPIDEIFLVPLRLEPCQIPRSIQQKTQYVDLFPEPATGLAKLLHTLREKPIAPRRK
ncbi:MAG: toll/interleukin-1 receptor domain-containing protein [Bryobacterales bacterium]|nr:toll/interleukin-1 receptor domain-containing protein [Bryobacterales bacterium]